MITEMDIKLIKQYWNSRLTIDQIAQMLPYPVYIAKSMIKSLKRDGTLPKRSLQQMTRDKVVDAYNSGIRDVAEIADIFHLEPSTVRVYLCDAGIKRHKNRKTYAHCERTEEILAAIRNREGNLTELAKRFGVSRQYVHQIKKRLKENEND